MAVYKDREYAVKSSPTCYPCLPRCHRSEITYCCDRRPSTTRMHCCEDDRDYPKECCYRGPRQRSPSCQRHSQRSPPPRARYCSPPHCCSPPPRCCSPPPDCCSPPPECCSPSPRCCYSPPPDCCSPPPDRSGYKPSCQPVRTKYVIPCYRYEDGRIVRKLPVTAFKRNGMQDQEHSKLLGTANFLVRCPRDVAIEYNVCKKQVHVCDPCKVPKEKERPLGSKLLNKKPIKENQPTVLMRRACEVAVGVRPRRKPFVHSSYSADDDLEVRRYHSEDEMGNCCFHFEAKNKGRPGFQSYPKDPASLEFANCVPSTVADPSGNCVYY